MMEMGFDACRALGSAASAAFAIVQGHRRLHLPAHPTPRQLCASSPTCFGLRSAASAACTAKLAQACSARLRGRGGDGKQAGRRLRGRGTRPGFHCKVHLGWARLHAKVRAQQARRPTPTAAPGRARAGPSWRGAPPARVPPSLHAQVPL